MKKLLPQMVVILHNIRSAHNVGSIFRTADAAGISRVYLSGYTPAPLDRFNRPVKEIAKTALGAEMSIPWEKIKNPVTLFKKLKAEGFSLAAIEQSPHSHDYRKFKNIKPLALIVGNEVRGVSPSLLKKVDTILEIPMHGEKESLNVAVAFGIVAFTVRGSSR